MKVKLVGVKDVDFTDRSGKRIDGVKLHYLTRDNNTKGYQAENSFISRDIVNDWGMSSDDLIELIESDINVDYNKFGKICGIAV